MVPVVAQGLREAGYEVVRPSTPRPTRRMRSNTIAGVVDRQRRFGRGDDRREWGVAVARLRDGRWAAGHGLVTEAAASDEAIEGIDLRGQTPAVRQARKGPIALVAILVFVVLSAMAYARSTNARSRR